MQTALAMSSLPFSEGYDSSHRYQFPQYRFPEHQKSTEISNPQDFVRADDSAYYHKPYNNNSPNLYGCLGQYDASAPFPTSSLDNSGHFPHIRPDYTNTGSLNPNAPVFGLVHSNSIPPEVRINCQDIIWSIDPWDQPNIRRHLMPQQHLGVDFGVYGDNKKKLSDQVEDMCNERNNSDQIRFLDMKSSMDQYVPEFSGQCPCCVASYMIPSRPSLAPAGVNYQDLPYGSFPFVDNRIDFNMNIPGPGFYYDPYRIIALNFPQPCNHFSSCAARKPLHYKNKNQNNKNAMTRHRTKSRSPISIQNKNPKKIKHVKTSFLPLACKEVVLAAQRTGSRNSNFLSPIKSSTTSTYDGSSEGKSEYGKDHEDIDQIPLATQNIAQDEFFSEKNFAASPNLRHQRKQSVSSAVFSNNSTVNEICHFNLDLNNKSYDSPSGVNLDQLSTGGLNIKLLVREEDRNLLTARIDSFPARSDTGPLCTTERDSFLFPRSGISLRNSPRQSPALNALVAMGQREPSIEEVFDSLPFIEYCRLTKADNFGVIKIKNIPYSISRPEVIAFLGTNARIISEEDHEPIHIIMERVTSKTLDCYVEFVTFDEAVNAVNRFEQGRSGGRSGKLGRRYVEIEISNQESLMQDLFPKAKNVDWNDGIPVIKPRDPDDKFNSGFRGFILKEELIMLVKHVETPQRSSFAKENPQRPFEFMISTLFKYPWYMVEYITIEDREMLHQTTVDLLRLLRERLKTNTDCVQLTPMLFKRLWRAALKCQGFSPSQKDDIAVMADLSWEQAQEFGLPPFAAFWKRLWTIGPRPGTPNDLILWYTAQIREATDVKKIMTLAERSAHGEQQREPELFGLLHIHIDYGDCSCFRSQTLAQVAASEWAGIEKILRQIFTDSKP